MRNEPGDYALRSIALRPDKLKTFFTSYLNRAYSAKEHLLYRLPEIIMQCNLSDLKLALTETMEDMERQLARMDEIYLLLNIRYTAESCEGVMGLVKDSFTAVLQQNGDMELRDLSILFYLQNIESVEMASFQVLQMAAVKLHNVQVKQLLKENFDEARADRALLLLIITKYLLNKSN